MIRGYTPVAILLQLEFRPVASDQQRTSEGVLENSVELVLHGAQGHTASEYRTAGVKGALTTKA